MSRPEDDAEASTMAVAGATLSDRSSRPVIEGLAAGATVGRYRLVRRLGAGAMGVVWSARDPELDRDVAIKLVHPALHSDEAASRFRREARAMAKLSHRSVITVHDTGVVDGQLFLAMELVRGTTLGQLLRERTPEDIADWPRWLAMMIEAGRGLAEAHRNGVLHRDFKPDNVLVDKAGRVCVGDFGLASLGDRQVVPSSSLVHPITLGDSIAFDLTTTGAVLGTPLYMSPQQLNAEMIDERADQFAFCVTLHEAMYGVRPFSTRAEGLAAIPGLVERIAAGVPEPPADTPVPRAIHDCIARGLAFEPEARWPDMDALLAALEQAQRKARLATAKPRPSSSRWLPLALIALGLAAGVVVVATRSSREAPSTAAEPIRPSAREVKLEKVFDTPLNTRIAMSPDGRTLALAGEELEIRQLDDNGEVSAINAIRLTMPVLYVELDDQQVRYSSERDGMRWAWNYRGKEPPVEMPPTRGGWRGDTVNGTLVRLANKSLGLVKAGGTIEPWPATNVEIAVISPDRKRVAYIEGGRFTGTITVRDVITGATMKSQSIDEPMALTWETSSTLLYASSTMVDPKIYRVDVSTRFGEPVVVYHQSTGWFSDLGTGGGNIFVVTMSPTPRGRVVERGKGNSELDSVSLAIGWDAQDRMVTWNRSSLSISSHAGKLASEPANATRAGDTLIASLREIGGRRAVAVTLSTGTERWRHPDRHTIAVRCAGDRAPPCFAIRYVDEELDRVVTVDPETGALGTTAIYEQRRIEDIAVRADGKALLITDGSELHEITSDGKPLATHDIRDYRDTARMQLVRSVAYSKSGIVVAGTVGRNAYQVGELQDGKYAPLDDAYDKILMLVRPSLDGSRVVFIARGYEPQLFRMKF